MTERDPGAERDPDESGVPAEGTAPGEAEGEGPTEGERPPQERREPTLPADEEAAWAAIVAAYGDEPVDDPADEPTEDPPKDPSVVLDKSDPPSESPEPDGDTLTRPREAPDEGGGDPPVRSLTVYAAGTGPRDWEAPEEDEGHFVPPEPPPLPETDTTTKFAWVAVLGGPLLLIGAILLQFDLTWWIVTLGVGGFMGGFATLVARMRDERDDDDWDDPGRGAVV